MSPIDSLSQNAESLHSREELSERLSQGRPLRIKFGVDPTRPDLTFGHMVVFNKLRQFQDLGHTAVLIIGDFTTLIGDPSGRSSTRPVLTRDEIRENAATYVEQAFKILDRDRTELRYNSEWFDKLGFEDCLKLARQMTVARMLERDDFSKRYKGGTPISIIEFLYPLVQGYDSMVIEADVELGGSDQLFNLLVGRQIQKDAGQKEQICLTMPLLVGLDGTRKMSKSADNYIAFNDSPKDLFGKIMSIDDTTMWTEYRLLLLCSETEIRELQGGHPMEAKKQLATALVDKLHGEGSGSAERQQFEQVFSRQEVPDEMPELHWSSVAGEGGRHRLTDLMFASGLFPAKKECRRMIEQGAVRIDGHRVDDPNEVLAPADVPRVIQAGKRKFVRLLP